jgi:hypothetical protein
MAMVAAQLPETEIFGFDYWLPNYAGVENPGPSFVMDEMRRVGFLGKLHLISGDSHRTLPSFFSARASSEPDNDGEFELILIDGDHSLLGASQDLEDTMPHCAVGGALVFDDIAPTVDPVVLKKQLGPDPHGWTNLLGLWHAMPKRFPNFRYFEFTHNPPGVGVAIRVS